MVLVRRSASARFWCFISYKKFKPKRSKF